VRYTQLNLGDNVFKDGLANRELWTNNIGLLDLGVNWYPNRWIKFYLDWQHAA
jgi:phosphate-selective porin OprO/OprP